MNRIHIYFFVILFSVIYGQCSDMNESECVNNNCDRQTCCANPKAERGYRHRGPHSHLEHSIGS